MKIRKLLYIFSSILVIFSSLEAYGRKVSCSSELPKAKDGQHGSIGYYDDGGNGENGENGKAGQNGGNGGSGGSSTYGNGGNGGNGGDAE